MSSDRTLLREYLEALLIAVIFATFARTYVVQAFKIPTGSMEENLLIGDHILVNKFVYGPAATPLESALLPVRKIERGDVVVFKFPNEPTRDFIKRCVGVPGDTIEVRDKALFVNGRKVDDDSYVYHTSEQTYPRTELFGDSLRGRDNFGPLQVPASHYFCMGDNRDNSNDSRFWGSVPESYVKGRAFMVYWSFEGLADEDVLDAPGASGRLRQIAGVALNFFDRTRWDRTFRIVR